MPLPDYEQLRVLPFAEDLDAILKALYHLTRWRDRSDSKLDALLELIEP